MADSRSESYTAPGGGADGQEHQNHPNEEHMLAGDEAEAFLELENEDDAGEEGEAETEADAGDDAEATGADESGGEEAQQDAGEEAAEAAESDQETGESEKEAEEPDAEQGQFQDSRFVPQYQLVDEGVTRDGLEQQLSDLDAQFNNGDLEMSDYLAQRDQVRDTMRNLDLQERLNQQAAQQEQADRVQQSWDAALERLHHQDASLVDNPLLANHLEQALQGIYSDQGTLQQFLVQDQAGNVVGYDYDGILNQAASTVNEAFGRQPVGQSAGGQQEHTQGGDTGGQDATSEQTDSTDQPAPKDVAQARGKKPEAPQTLGGAPAAEGESASDSSLDGLEGQDLEKALAGMSESQIQAFLDQ